MTSTLRTWATLLTLAAGALAARDAGAQAAPACVGQPACMAVSSFVATVTDFRTSTSGRTRVVTLTLRFRNTAARPLRLGYVQGSGIVTDDQGNRYVTYGNDAVRGMGLIANGSFDPKFELQPGESSDARFELVWEPGDRIIGTRYTMELAVREMDPVSATQLRLGREHALQFRGLGEPAAVATEAAIAVEPVAGGSVAAPAAPADPCAGRTRCYGAGPFTAEIVQLTGSRMANNTGDHALRLNVRFRNLTAEPLILAYKASTSLATDAQGNRYHWGTAGTYDRSARGIGISSGRSVDPQFVLRPGESRDATFEVRRYRTGRNAVIGSTFAWDVAIEQLELLPSDQVRVTREYSVSFTDLATGASAQAQVENAGRALLDRLRGAAKKPPR